MSKYRNKLQIIADILVIVRNGSKKTHIMYQANLSYKLLRKYLDKVITAGLVKTENGDSYVLTGKGEEFLNRHEEYSKAHKRAQKERSILETMFFTGDRQ